MAQCHIQVVQPIILWQHTSVTQAIQYPELQQGNVKLTRHGVIRPLLAI